MDSMLQKLDEVFDYYDKQENKKNGKGNRNIQGSSFKRRK